MSTTISPSLGHGAPFTQLGVGTSPGFDAIDLRRTDTVGLAEAPLSLSSYTVGQRGAGANLSVDIAAATGPGAIVQGDTVTQQGRYVVPPHTAVINEVIATADATNPRIDSVILEIKDSTHDASGLNLAQTRVVTGTPIAAVTLEAPGASPAALPNSAQLLAYVLVPALASTIPTANIKDMRPKRRGKVNTATAESTTQTAYAYNNLATPDRVTQIVLPTDGLIAVWFQALWQNTVTANARAAIFLNANQLKTAPGGGAGTIPVVQEATGNTTINVDAPLSTVSTGIFAQSDSGTVTEVTTGQALGTSNSTGAGGVCYVFAAAGTYDVGVQVKNVGAGTLTMKNRHLWVQALDFDQCQFT